jgi:hypothetical protein
MRVEVCYLGTDRLGFIQLAKKLPLRSSHKPSMFIRAV